MTVRFDSEYVIGPALTGLSARGSAKADEFRAWSSKHGALDAVAASRVAICVCTAERPRMLSSCLEAIGSQIIPQGVEVDVVVVDNEGAPNNRRLVHDFFVRYPFPVHYVHEPRRGIPQARNAGLKVCERLGVDWIAFTDDDCWVGPSWIANLMDAARRHRCDVVAGRREFITPTPMPFWAMGSTHSEYRDGQEARYASTHNVLFSARLIRQSQDGLRFDERLTHGEDTDFFYRATQRGSRIVHSDEPVFETLTLERCSLRYQAKHAYYCAASRGNFHRRYKSPATMALKLAARWLVQVPVGFARLLSAPIVWLASDHAFKASVVKGTVRLTGAAGASAGLLGFTGNPYRKIDGF